MIQQFLNHIQHHNLCKTSDKILLAVSGGLDSMVMLHLFHQQGFNIAVAHCNFQLRGEESAGDQEFASQVCSALNIPLFTKVFDTAAIASEKKQSIQVVARELRYAFFQQVLKENNFFAIATAHHLNDVLETVLLNITRGTGIDGLAGIPVKTQNIIRPMLFASRDNLKAYAKKNNLLWREDSSNQKDDYQRNFIRHHVVPLLKKVNPALEETFKDTHERIVSAQALAKKQLESIQNDIFLKSGNRIAIDKRKLSGVGSSEVVLWELLKDYGFNYTQCKDLATCETSGKRFWSADYRITVDRDSFLLDRHADAVKEEIIVNAQSTSVYRAGDTLVLKQIDFADFTLIKNAAIAQLDAEKVTFPLVWRPWKPGDALIPLGMENSKKISDLLIDSKIALPDKEKITVIESRGEIVWVVGMRIHDRFKVTGTTKRVLLLKVETI
ncbi:tRNA lysidine(34) synthetase TilS [Chryseosolibacter indicus]|uniref:tRNA(Ile)-lysidine synthase n=1 Tax=Chryseosolibacter indicus TaxID=2782351 RepID=A0ABS5VL81_9BACT|nr:tRNA lysidine(34) synthetase TilS [Chryseosolibacter indicus]